MSTENHQRGHIRYDRLAEIIKDCLPVDNSNRINRMVAHRIGSLAEEIAEYLDSENEWFDGDEFLKKAGLR